jgi:hypothetical protein
MAKSGSPPLARAEARHAAASGRPGADRQRSSSAVLSGFCSAAPESRTRSWCSRVVTSVSAETRRAWWRNDVPSPKAGAQALGQWNGSHPDAWALQRDDRPGHGLADRGSLRWDAHARATGKGGRVRLPSEALGGRQRRPELPRQGGAPTLLTRKRATARVHSLVLKSHTLFLAGTQSFVGSFTVNVCTPNWSRRLALRDVNGSTPPSS